MDELQRKTEDVISSLRVTLEQAKDLERQRRALEEKDRALNMRAQKVQDKELAQNQLATDLSSQRKYIDEQTTRNEKLLEGIKKEREILVVTDKERSDYSKNNEYLKIREQNLEQRTLDLQRDKALFKKQEEATKEYQQLLEVREKRIKIRETALDNMEKQTQV